MIVRALGFAFLLAFIFNLKEIHAAVPNLQKDKEFRNSICEALATNRHFFKYDERYFSVDADPLQFIKVLDLDRKDLKTILCRGKFTFTKVKRSLNELVELSPIKHNENLLFFYEVNFEKEFKDFLFPKGIHFTLVVYDYQNEDSAEEDELPFKLNLLDPFVKAVMSSEQNVRNGIPGFNNLNSVEDSLKRVLVRNQSRLTPEERAKEESDLLKLSVAWDRFKEGALETFIQFTKKHQVQTKLPLEILAKELAHYLMILEVQERVTPQSYRFSPFIDFVKALQYIEEQKFPRQSLSSSVEDSHDADSSGEEDFDPSSLAAIRYCRSVGGEVHAYKIGSRQGSSEIAKLCSFGDAEIGIETLFKFYLTKKRSLAISHFLNDSEAARVREAQRNSPYPQVDVFTSLDPQGRLVHELVTHPNSGQPPLAPEGLTPVLPLEEPSTSLSSSPELHKFIGSYYINPNTNNQNAKVRNFCRELGGTSVKLFGLPELTRISRGCVFLDDDSGINARTLFDGSEHEGSAQLKEVLFGIEGHQPTTPLDQIKVPPQ